MVMCKAVLQAEKKMRPKIQKRIYCPLHLYSDKGLSGYTVYSLKAVLHRCIFFVFMVCSGFYPPAVQA